VTLDAVIRHPPPVPYPVRLLRGVVFVLLAAVAVASGLFLMRNPERAPIDEAARRAASAQSMQLTVGSTHYDVTGPDTGRTVVLVHGFSVPMYIWDSTVSALSAAGFRVVRYDMFGRGYSDRPDAPYDGAFYTQQLDELLDTLRVTEPVDLMALSFGGFVAGHFVPARRERVRTLTLVDPVATSTPVPGFLSWPLVGAWIWQVTQVPGMADNQAADFLHPERFPGWDDAYRPQMRFRGFGRALLRSAMASSRVNYDSLYAAVGRTGVPVLLVWGRQDRTVPFEQSEVVRRAIPALQFAPIDSAGHLPHMEQSAATHAQIKAFLALHD
jgi:pimeloyl-ACP methyl ester carboxylesterase